MRNEEGQSSLRETRFSRRLYRRGYYNNSTHSLELIVHALLAQAAQVFRSDRE